ncbi:helix-turn-helix domain-containing protein [Streptomyces gamaensis]|uniref:Helix-turn-helix domain-containing protein n=1 Tax=Streptomyces gamaensis TaxID=1763542 RepID=A0ABW0YYZ5_9ACTN
MAEATDPIEEFAELLRALKARSGHSYGVLAKRLHLSTSTLHRYCNGAAVPTEYAPLERFARVCGATPKELVELHRRWILADDVKRRRTTVEPGAGASGGVAPGTGPGAGASSEVAPAPAEPTDTTNPATGGIPETPDEPSTPARPTDPTAASAEPTPTAPAPGGPGSTPPRTPPAPPRRRRPARRLLAVALAAVAVPGAAVVGFLVSAPDGGRKDVAAPERGAEAAPRRGEGGGPAPSASASAGAGAGESAVPGAPRTAFPMPPTGSAPQSLAPGGSGLPGFPGGQPAPPGGGTAGPEVTDPPLTVDIRPYTVEDRCRLWYLSGRTPAEMPDPRTGEPRDWARAIGAVPGGMQKLELSVQGKNGQAVVLHSLTVRTVSRTEPLSWSGYAMGNGCGGALTPAWFDVDLDADRPVAKPMAGQQGDTRIPATDFPFKVSSTDPQVLEVEARTTAHDVVWYLELEWSSGGRRGTLPVYDHGRPFRTSALKDRPQYTYWADRKLWTPVAEENRQE